MPFISYIYMSNTISLGQRALELAIKELGVVETPAHSNAGPKIKEYFAKCERNGKPLGLTAGNWCAAFASWCGFNACETGEKPPHLYRAAVTELWKDAVASGTAKPTSYVPKVGDLAIFTRGGQNPTKGGEGHVGRVSVVPDENGNYETLDGNHDDRVARVKRKLGAELVGWIAYPEPAPEEVKPEPTPEPKPEPTPEPLPVDNTVTPAPVQVKSANFLELLFQFIAKLFR